MRKLLYFCLMIVLMAACASLGTPDGGPYDETPPQVVVASPANQATNSDKKKINILFDEYIKIENASEKVIVSPPQTEMANVRADGKKIKIELFDTLRPNTTYTIDFADAIVDNNEGNPMGNYTFTFSTGEQIDTMQVAGYALDASNLEPIKGILVGLYRVEESGVDSVECRVDGVEFATAPQDDSSAVANSTLSTLHSQQKDTLHSQLTPTLHSKLKTTPMLRVSRTNGRGFFSIKGVAPGRYIVRALADADGDFVYGQKSETVGFTGDTIVPRTTMGIRQDTLWKDPLHIDKITQTEYLRYLPDDLTLLCFQAKLTDRYLVKTERKEPEKIGFFFSYGNDSLPVIRGLNFQADSAFVIEASEKRDTVYYWLRDTTLVNQDTLRMEATFLITDSTGTLVAKTDTIEALAKTPYAKRLKNKLKETEQWEKEQEKKKKRGEAYDSVRPPEFLKPKISPSGQMAPNQNVCFEFDVPLDSCNMEGVHLYSMIDSVWYRAPHLFQQVGTRQYVLKAEWRPGIEYSLEVDSMAFINIYGIFNKPIKQGLKVTPEERFSSLMVSLTHAPDSGTVYVELMDGSDKVSRREKAVDGTAEFYYVRPGKYYLRAFVDLNDNGIWDTGDYDSGRQAEEVFYYHEEVECKEKWDVTRNWDLTYRPRYQQKPAAITKQKPDKDRQVSNRNAQRAAEKGITYVPKNK